MSKGIVKETLALPVETGARHLLISVGRLGSELITTVEQLNGERVAIRENSISLPIDVLLVDANTKQAQEERDSG